LQHSITAANGKAKRERCDKNEKKTEKQAIL
jgi:hypothetical protein